MYLKSVWDLGSRCVTTFYVFLTLVVSVFKIESPASSGVEQNAVCEKCFVANETSPDIPTT